MSLDLFVLRSELIFKQRGFRIIFIIDNPKRNALTVYVRKSVEK